MILRFHILGQQKERIHEASLAESTKIQKVPKLFNLYQRWEGKKHTDSVTRELEDSQSLIANESHFFAVL